MTEPHAERQGWGDARCSSHPPEQIGVPEARGMTESEPASGVETSWPPLREATHETETRLTMFRHASTMMFLTFGLLGCQQSLEEQVQKEPSRVLGKTTQDIGQFDPKAGKPISDSKIQATDPVTAPVSAYGPMLEQISKTHIAHAVNLFYATEGRYPESYDEFMQKIIRANNIQLPVLPGGKRYEYDVANHQLVVVDASPAGETSTPTTPATAP